MAILNINIDKLDAEIARVTAALATKAPTSPAAAALRWKLRDLKKVKAASNLIARLIAELPSVDLS
jgi:hypothetical protein